MNQLLENYFCKTYPKIFRDMYKNPQQTCMAWGIACGDGWFSLLDTLCYSIQARIDHRKEMIKKKYALPDENNPIPQVVAAQIKEKFGGLRFYYNGGDECIRHMVDYSEELSCRICENCGKFNEDVGRTDGWIQSLCSECSSEYKKDIKHRKELVDLWKKVIKSRTHPKRAWKGMDEPFTKEDLTSPYLKNKPIKKKKGKK